jgi:lysyl endopeptidase
MSRNLAWLMLLVFGSVAHAAAAAVVPTAAQFPVLDVNRLDSVVLTQLDLARIGQEDVARDREGLAPRFAIPEQVSVSPADHGTWEDLGNGQMLWRLRIVGREGTTSLNLGFTHYKMSAGGRLLLYSTDGSQMMRPFTADDNEAHGELWTPVILTKDLIVEVTVPAAEKETFDLRIGWINQGYRGFGTISADSYLKSGSCNLDVECLDAGDSWRDQMRAVAVISTGGSTFCSGSLVNDTANDHKMYFMTANHCGINTGNAASLVAFWNYQNSFCRTPGSPASGAAGDGTLTQFHTGSFFRAGNAPSDFTLVELDDPPVPAYNHFWAGWDRSTGDFTCTAGVPCAGIHHPNTDEKRITYVTTNTATTSYNNPSSPGDGTHVWAHWATDPPGPFTVPGVTEPGSSGSPLYNALGRYIGQLHGGPSACGATGDNLSDYYGRFSVSWTGGGTSSTRLSNWLDAGNTGATAIDGVNQCTAPGAPAIGTAAATGANQIQVTWADGAPPSTTFNVYRAVGTCASPGPFSPVATAVAGSPYTDNTVSGGTTYAYHVTGVDSSGGCESAASACVEATATGACTLPPTFAGLASASNNASASCGVSLAWSAATAHCGGPVTYRVYRSTTPGFTPSPAELIAGGVSGTGYVDIDGALTSGTTYYYIVRAVDGTNSAVDTNTVTQSTAPTGPIAPSTLTETFESVPGSGFDNPGWTHSALSGAVDWVWSTAQSQTPTHSWFSADQTTVSHRVLVTPELVPQAGTTLSFWHTFAFEGTVAQCYDAGTLESSTDNGSTWTVVPDAIFTAGGFNGTVNGGFSNPLAGKRAWCSGTIGAMAHVTANLGSFTGASTMKLRWHEGDDSSLTGTGWYVDSVTIANAGVAGTCTSGPPPATGYDFFTVTPCRVADTRDPDGPLGGPALQPSENRTFIVTGTCGVPSTAKAVSVNVTVVGAAADGFMTLYPSDQSLPPASTVNFQAGQTRGNNAIIGLATDASGGITVANGSAGTAHFILDVNGYFE